jgi:hypothetical protein
MMDPRGTTGAAGRQVRFRVFLNADTGTDVYSFACGMGGNGGRTSLDGDSAVDARDGTSLVDVSPDGSGESDVLGAEAGSDLFSSPSVRDCVTLKNRSNAACWSPLRSFESALNISFALSQLCEKTAI